MRCKLSFLLALILAVGAVALVSCNRGTPQASQPAASAPVVAQPANLPAAPPATPAPTPAAKESAPEPVKEQKTAAIVAAKPTTAPAVVKPVAASTPAASNEQGMEGFAKCLGRKQAKMYGAFWCTHCAEQKEKFGPSFAFAPYTECAILGMPPGQQTEACKQMQIKKYPTWIFSDGERVEGVMPLEDLSKRTGCKLP